MMPVIKIKDTRLTYYEVLKKNDDGWGWDVFVLRGIKFHESLDEAMEVAKGLEAHGYIVRVRPVYVNQWGVICDRGSAVYTTEKERKKHDGKVQKA